MGAPRRAGPRRRPAGRAADRRSGSTPCSSTPTATPTRCSFTLQPRAGIVTRRVVAVNAVLAGCPPETFPVRAHRGAGARPPRGQPAGRERHDPPRSRRCSSCTARSCSRAGFNAGRRRLRARQPGQRHRRPGRAPGDAARRRRPPGLGRRRHPRPAREVHVLRRREPRGARPWESYPRQPWRRRAERRHRALRRGPAQRARRGGRRRPRAHPRQDRVGHDLARAEQRADQPGRVLHRPRARARGHDRRSAALDPQRRLVVPVRPGPPAGVAVPAPLPGAGLGAVDEDRRPTTTCCR